MFPVVVFFQVVNIRCRVLKCVVVDCFDELFATVGIVYMLF